MARPALRTLLLALALWLAAGTVLAHGMSVAGRVELQPGGQVRVSLYDVNGAPVKGAAVRLRPGGELAADPAGGYTGTASLPASGQVRLEVIFAGDRWDALLELSNGAIVRPGGGVALLTPVESTLAHGGWVWLLIPVLLVAAAAGWLLLGRRGRRRTGGGLPAGLLTLALLAVLLGAGGCGTPKPEGLEVVAQANGPTVDVDLRNTGKWTVGKDGHAHLYLNGNPSPITIVEPRYTYPKLPPGTHSIRVELTGHDHKPLGVEKTVTVEVK